MRPSGVVVAQEGRQPWPHDTAQLLGVHVQQLAWRLPLVAHDGLNRIERLEAGQAQPSQGATHGGDAAAHDAGNAAHGHTGSAQPLNALGKILVNTVPGSLRSGTAIPEGLLSTFLEAP